MKTIICTVLAVVVLTCNSVYAQPPVLRAAFRIKFIEAIQDVDAVEDSTTGQMEHALNRFQARRSVQELGRIAQAPNEIRVAAGVAQYLLGIQTCEFGKSTFSPAAAKECSDRADKQRTDVLALAGVEGRLVYPHGS